MISLSEGVSLSDVDGCVVLSSADGDIAVLNETASLVLNDLLRGTSKKDTISTLSCKSGAPEVRIAADVEDLLSGLKEKNLVV